MSNRIHYDQSFNLSKMLAQCVHSALECRAAMIRVQKILDMAQWGSPADWPALAAELGLETIGTYTKEQQAQDLYNVFSNARARLDDAAIVELSRLDQG